MFYKHNVFVERPRFGMRRSIEPKVSRGIYGHARFYLVCIVQIFIQVKNPL